MLRPLVSIVLPTYNGSRYLEGAIRSCLNQTYANIEIVVVDDASTDKTAQIAEALAAEDSRIRYYLHTRNRKLPAALNSGFENAVGEYLTWTSDDNVYSPRAIEIMVNELESHPNIDIVHSDYVVMDSSEAPMQYIAVTDVQNLAFFNCVGACFLYRRSVYETLGYYADDLYLVEDYDYWLRASTSTFKFKQIHQELYYFRIHAKSLSTLQKDKVEIAFCQALERSLPNMTWLDPSIRASAYLNLARLQFKWNRRHQSRKWLLKALWLSPRLVMQCERLLLSQIPIARRALRLF